VGDAYLIGLDLGTTNAKALVCDAAGRIVRVTSRRMPLRELGGGWAEYDPGAVWETAAAVLREAVGAIPDARALRAIAVTSMGEAGVPCSEDGSPLYPAIAWFDTRSAPQAEALDARIGERALYEITGVPAQPIYTVHKLAWLHDNEPDVFRRMRSWYFMADYALARLCGAWVTDPSLASRSRAFDIRRHRWASEILDAAQIPPGVLPPVVPSGSPAGRLLPDVARDLGMPAEVLVAVGGHDHICAALASGVTKPGDILDSMGTAEALLGAADAPPPPEVTAAAGFAVGCHVVADQFYLLGGIAMSGGAVDWIARLAAMPVPDLMEQASRVAPGAEGLCFLPHLRGSLSPVVDALSAGAFLGLRDVHRPAHLARAVLEGLACEAKANVDALEAVVGRAGVMRVTGGGARLPLWLGIKAAVLDRPLEVLATAECAALGAALLGGMAAGVFADAAKAMHAGVRIGTRVYPDPALARVMADRDRIYRDLYATVKPIHRRLRAGAAGAHERAEG
jgi:xylulokinase